MTDFGEVGYGGPAPPDKRHTYVFKLYALDTELDLERRSTKADVENAMEGHIIEQQNLQAHTRLENLIRFFCYTQSCVFIIGRKFCWMH